MSFVVPDLVVATVIIILTLCLVEFLRLVLRRATANKSPLEQKFVQEFLAAFEMCCVCYEFALVLNEYGVFVYSLFLFTVNVWWNLRWTNATAAPYTHITDWVAGKNDFRSVGTIILSEMLGGMIYYRLYLVPLWTLAPAGIAHHAKLENEFCHSDIRVAIMYAALVEGAAVFVSQLLIKIFSGQAIQPIYGAVVESAIGTVLVLATLNISGGYFNPVLATATQYGCIGSSPFDHFFVYWIAETIGAILAYALWTHTSISSLFGSKTKPE